MQSFILLSLVIVAIVFAQEITDDLIEKQFAAEDKDNSGDVTLAEIIAAAEQQGGASVPAEVRKILETNFKTTDTDGDGKLSLAEVKAQVERNKAAAGQGPQN